MSYAFKLDCHPVRQPTVWGTWNTTRVWPFTQYVPFVNPWQRHTYRMTVSQCLGIHSNLQPCVTADTSQTCCNCCANYSATSQLEQFRCCTCRRVIMSQVKSCKTPIAAAVTMAAFASQQFCAQKYNSTLGDVQVWTIVRCCRLHAAGLERRNAAIKEAAGVVIIR